MAHSDIFVNPSYSEGLPSSVLEAASCCKPIIATDVGGTSEIIKHGGTGILIKPHDVNQLAIELMNLLEHPFEARQMGIRAMQSINGQFSWNKIIDQYENIFKEMKC